MRFAIAIAFHQNKQRRWRRRRRRQPLSTQSMLHGERNISKVPRGERKTQWKCGKNMEKMLEILRNRIGRRNEYRSNRIDEGIVWPKYTLVPLNNVLRLPTANTVITHIANMLFINPCADSIYFHLEFVFTFSFAVDFCVLTFGTAAHVVIELNCSATWTYIFGAVNNYILWVALEG